MLGKLIRNKKSLLLLATILAGVVVSFIGGSQVERAINWNGSEGHFLSYHNYFTGHYLIFAGVVIGYLIEETTYIDKVMTVTYFIFELLSLISYQYQGWPEPKILIVSCFAYSVSIYLLLVWKKS